MMKIIHKPRLTSCVKDIYAYIYPFCHNNRKVLHFIIVLKFRNTQCAQITHLYILLYGLRSNRKEITVVLKNINAVGDNMNKKVYYKPLGHKLSVLFLSTLCRRNTVCPAADPVIEEFFCAGSLLVDPKNCAFSPGCNLTGYVISLLLR